MAITRDVDQQAEDRPPSLPVSAVAGEDLARILECERRIINAWPAPTTLILGDWVLRMANGYSGRANSVSALVAGASLDDAALATIESLYRAEGLPPIIRITPLVATETQARILARGYRMRDTSFGMLAALAGREAPNADIHIAPQANPTWVNGVCALQADNKSNAQHLATIVANIRMPAAFATLLVDGQPVAYGMSVAEGAMAEIGSVVVQPARRGRGHGRVLVEALMAWGRASGCDTAFLQVDRSNAVGIRLYEALGFATLYSYETRVLP